MQACRKQASPSAAAELLQSCGWWAPHEQLGLIKAGRAEIFPAPVQVCMLPHLSTTSCKAASSPANAGTAGNLSHIVCTTVCIPGRAACYILCCSKVLKEGLYDGQKAF